VIPARSAEGWFIVGPGGDGRPRARLSRSTLEELALSGEIDGSTLLASSPEDPPRALRDQSGLLGSRRFRTAIEAFLDAGRDADCLRVIERWHDVQPRADGVDAARVLFLEARVHEARDLVRARDVYRQVLELREAELERVAHNNAGVLDARAGETHRALTHFALAANGPPHFVVALENQRLLLEHVLAIGRRLAATSADGIGPAIVHALEGVSRELSAARGLPGEVRRLEDVDPFARHASRLLPDDLPDSVRGLDLGESATRLRFVREVLTLASLAVDSARWDDARHWVEQAARAADDHLPIDSTLDRLRLLAASSARAATQRSRIDGRRAKLRRIESLEAAGDPRAALELTRRLIDESDDERECEALAGLAARLEERIAEDEEPEIRDSIDRDPRAALARLARSPRPDATLERLARRRLARRCFDERRESFLDAIAAGELEDAATLLDGLRTLDVSADLRSVITTLELQLVRHKSYRALDYLRAAESAASDECWDQVRAALGALHARSLAEFLPADGMRSARRLQNRLDNEFPGSPGARSPER